MRTVAVSWDPELDRFTALGSHAAHPITINAPRREGGGGTPTGFSPAELLLASIGSCSAWDVVEIARKGRLELTSVEVDVVGDQAPEPPYEYRHIELRYRVGGRALARPAVERAVRLSFDRYCSVLATVRGVASTSWSLEVVAAPPR